MSGQGGDPAVRSRALWIVAILIALGAIGISSVFMWAQVYKQTEGQGRFEAADQRASGVFYEIFVRSFYDSNGDGIGDLNGVTAKLDYLQSLGISGLWLTPIHPSPSYHGYDVTDYYDIHPDFGTMEDFERLIEEAHKRNIQIVMDLVVNHSSIQHPWFIESARGADSPYRDWYIWADTEADADTSAGEAAGAGASASANRGAKLSAISAVGGKAWHARNGGHYLGIFWEGMPDLNLDHPDVRAEIIKIGQFWLNKGVDGFRLDAAKHIYEDFQGDAGNPEIAGKNQAWWQEFRRGLNEVKPDAYLVGEVWDSTAVIGPYLDQAFNACFNFDLAGQLLAAAKSEKAVDIASKLSRIYEYYDRVSGGTFEDAIFLTNHDQNRVMSQLQGNADHAKMAASMLLTLPGKPYIYYGEEIGMQGMKPDEYIREPMLWYAGGAQGEGQVTWETSRFNRNDPPSVEMQEQDEQSLLQHYRMLIHWRKLEPVLVDGAIGAFSLKNNSILAFTRQTESEQVLVLHNLSGQEQAVTLEQAFHKIILTTSSAAALTGDQVILPAYSTVVFK